jgi:hypothetical protein
MDNAARRAAEHNQQLEEHRARYTRNAVASARRHGTATFHVGNIAQLEDANVSTRNNHPRGTVQRIFITNNNRIAKRNLKNRAYDMANQYDYLVIFIEDNPDP